uniref:Uncharacterized protein n=1 Tax=Anguilla anguilla TaxID=7936 RepID=A0A0E9VVI8_ANGAN
MKRQNLLNLHYISNSLWTPEHHTHNMELNPTLLL